MRIHSLNNGNLVLKITQKPGCFLQKDFKMKNLITIILVAFLPSYWAVAKASSESTTSNKISVPTSVGADEFSFGCDVYASSLVMLVRDRCYDFKLPSNVYVYRSTPDGFVFQKKLASSTYQNGALNDRGFDISGNLIAVGNPYDNPHGYTEEGSVTVNYWNGSSWEEETVILPVEYREENLNLGASVAIDGDRLVVGAPGASRRAKDGFGDTRLYAVGKAFVWKRTSAGKWEFQTAIQRNDKVYNSKYGFYYDRPIEAFEYFGYLVRMRNNTIYIGQGDGQYAPSLHIFDPASTGWVDGNGSSYWNPINMRSQNGQFGVDVKNDLIAIGKPNGDQVVIYKRSGGAGSEFQEYARLSAENQSSYNLFGYSVQFCNDRLMVGRPGDYNNGRDAGSAYVYQETTEGWVQELKIKTNPGAIDAGFGGSISGCGNKLLSGANGSRTSAFKSSKQIYGLFNYNLPPRWQLTLNITGEGVVYTDPTGNDCSSQCEYSFNGGQYVTIIPSANTGSTFTGWSGACDGTGPCTVSMDTSKTVTANFSKVTSNPSLTISQ